MEGSQFYSDWIFDDDYFNFEEGIERIQSAQNQSSGGTSTIDSINNVLKQITGGIDRANNMQTQPVHTGGNYPVQNRAGIGSNLTWVVGGMVFIAGAAWVTKKVLDDK